MRRWALFGAALLGVLLIGARIERGLHGLTLVVRAADLRGIARWLADADTVLIVERMIDIRVRDGSIRARVYAPTGAARHTVLLVSGLHPGGIDEIRLMDLARKLAEANVTVVTPEFPELSRFAITPHVTAGIEEAASRVAADSGLSPAGRIGLMGISFSGGLAVVAAGRPSLRGRLLYVFSLGGHDDLPRVLEYLCTGAAALLYDMPGPVGAEGTPPPHDYGVAVALLHVVDRMVPPDQVVILRDAVHRFLLASHLDRRDQPGAEREFAALRELARSLPEPAATLLTLVNERDVARLGPRLLPHVRTLADAPSLSPSRSPALSAPLFLLHGRSDNVIPAAESRRLADRLRGRVPVRLLLTDVIAHVDADQAPHVADVLRLAGFWGDLLAR